MLVLLAAAPVAHQVYQKLGGWNWASCSSPFLDQTADPEPCLNATLVVLPLALAVGALFMIVSIVFMIKYKSEVTDKRQPMPHFPPGQMGDFNSDIFDCISDLGTCLHGCFCGMCRAGDTYQAAGLDSYYNVIMKMFAANLIGSLASGLAPGIGQLVTFTLYAAFFTQHRRDLRKKMCGNDAGNTYLQDFVCWCFCSSCVVCQEARVLDKEMGVQVSGCCKMTQAAMPPMVGPPVVVAPGQTGLPVTQGQPPMQCQPTLQQPMVHADASGVISFGAMQCQPTLQQPMMQGLPTHQGQV